MVISLNDAIRPWVLLLARIVRDRQVRRICEVMDMEGCFTNMPKDAIKFGLRDLTSQIKGKTGFTGVVVPSKKGVKCEWVEKTKKRIGITKIPFEIMLEVIEFGLENTFIKDRFGGLRRQVKGIPMGDPNSPGMCIGACAWMEMEWMKGLDTETKKRFRAIRYMDGSHPYRP